jgi:exodeoxyribonuclease V alpha subunit
VRHVYRARADGQLARDDQERLAVLHRELHRTRVLCATRARPTGTAAVNAWMHARHLEDIDSGGGGASGAQAAFLPGEPVMVLRNDYQRGLFNGDQGLVIRFDEQEGDGRAPRLAAAFPTRQGWQAFPIDGVGDGLELSFAMTVHKAQGSELDSALLLLPDVPIPILTRELLYTAVTRVRHGVVICGAPGVLAAAAAAPLVRSSGLADKLGT